MAQSPKLDKLLRQRQRSAVNENRPRVVRPLKLFRMPLNDVWYAFRFSIRSFLMSIWRLQVSSRKQHQQSHQWTHKHKTYIGHSFRAQYWYLHSVVFPLCLFIQNQDIWKISSFYCSNGLDFPFVPPIAFTIKMRHTRGIFAKKCITMCADMNI